MSHSCCVVKDGKKIDSPVKIKEPPKSNGDGNGGNKVPKTVPVGPTPPTPIPSQTPAKALQPRTPGQILAPLLVPIIDWAVKQVVGNEGFQALSYITQNLPSINSPNSQTAQPATTQFPTISEPAARTAVYDLLLRTANTGGQSQAIRALTNLQTDVQTNSAAINKIGELAELYQRETISPTTGGGGEEIPTDTAIPPETPPLNAGEPASTTQPVGAPPQQFLTQNECQINPALCQQQQPSTTDPCEEAPVITRMFSRYG